MTDAHGVDARMVDARAVGDRIEELLAGLQSGKDRGTAEELVRLLVEMYGEGLARIVAAVGPDGVARLAEDELVESLLLLHDLHPLDVNARIERALDRVRPYLGSHAGGVRFLGVDDLGVARLSLEGSCDGCASSTVTVRMAIEGAVQDAAPELTGIEVDGVVDEGPALLQVGMGPPPGWTAGPQAAQPGGSEPKDQPGSATGNGTPTTTPNGSLPAGVPASTGGWATLPEIGPPTGKPVVVEVGGMRVLVCSVRGTLYAYRDACAGCGASLAEGTLNGNLLACPACGVRFNVRLAGRGMDSTHHLDPLPLLSDSAGTRVAVPRAVPS
jgi:Fe-S cluster biogenesis protein NfuA/DNA-directed RNA polymerase subunit RPC12/RpoP